MRAALPAEAFKAGGVISPIGRERDSGGSVVHEGRVNLPGGGEIGVEVAPDGRVPGMETP